MMPSKLHRRSFPIISRGSSSFFPERMRCLSEREMNGRGKKCVTSFSSSQRRVQLAAPRCCSPISARFPSETTGNLFACSRLWSGWERKIENLSSRLVNCGCSTRHVARTCRLSFAERIPRSGCARMPVAFSLISEQRKCCRRAVRPRLVSPKSQSLRLTIESMFTCSPRCILSFSRRKAGDCETLVKHFSG